MLHGEVTYHITDVDHGCLLHESFVPKQELDSIRQ